MFDIEQARKLTLHWPITVERYDSGQLGFIARPQVQGRRLNQSFSTSKYGTVAAAAEAAIAWCQEMRKELWWQRDHIPEHVQSELVKLVKRAAEYGVDPIKAFQDGVMLHIQKRLETKS